MTQFIDIVCQNKLTGAISEFGKISDREVHAKLINLVDSKSIDEDLYYVKHLENFIFAAYRRIKFMSNDGKTHFINYKTEEIDRIVNDLYGFLSDQTNEIIEYTHDIQYLIGALNASSVVKPHEEHKNEVLLSKLEQVNLVSILVSAKSAFFRYLTEDTERLNKSEVSITGKCFKIHKGLKFLAESKGKTVKSDFKSSSKSKVKMVDIFEFIPYIIVENAIKYGPKDLEIDFKLDETKISINVEISSLGPLLADDELESIFSRGVRGKSILNTGIAGHGMGLFQAQEASKHLFSGNISVRQVGSEININGTIFRDTVFKICIPISG